jgi:hypothetical protein
MTSKQSTLLWRRMWPFALLCVLASMFWLLLDRYPEIDFTLASDAAACGFLAVVALVAVLLSRRMAISPSQALQSAIAGALVLAGPTAGSFLHASTLNPSSLAIALCLTPVVVGVAEAVTSDVGLSNDALWPGLAAAAGLLLVLPSPYLGDWRSDAAMVLAPILTGIGCVFFRRGAAPALSRTTAGFAGAAMLFMLAAGIEATALHTRPQISFAATAIDAILSLLTLFALGRITAGQYTARYLLVPFLLLLQGPLLLHTLLPLITWRNAVCAALLLAAAIKLLRSNSLEKVTS